MTICGGRFRASISSPEESRFANPATLQPRSRLGSCDPVVGPAGLFTGLFKGSVAWPGISVWSSQP